MQATTTQPQNFNSMQTILNRLWLFYYSRRAENYKLSGLERQVARRRCELLRMEIALYNLKKQYES